MNHRILSFVLCYLLLSAIDATAQLTKDNRAIVHLNDGSVYVGHIIKEGAQTIDLLILTGDTIHIMRPLIDRMLHNTKNVLIHNNGKIHHTKGTFISTNMGGGGDNNQNGSFEWDFIVGKRFNKYVSAGLGFGVGVSENLLGQSTLIEHEFAPIFAYGRFYLTHNKARLFIASSLGYGVAANENTRDVHSGGLYVQPSIGVHFASRKKGRFVISVGQMLQYTSGTTTDLDVFANPVIFNYETWYNRTLIKFGYEFN